LIIGKKKLKEEEEEDNESRWPSSKRVCGSWNAKKIN
jgi:hypothetical protein